MPLRLCYELQATPASMVDYALQCDDNVSLTIAIKGRSIAIVPRTWAARGYLDIDHDDYAADDPLSAWQHLVLKSSHRLTVSLNVIMLANHFR